MRGEVFGEKKGPYTDIPTQALRGRVPSAHQVPTNRIEKFDDLLTAHHLLKFRERRTSTWPTIINGEVISKDHICGSNRAGD